MPCETSDASSVQARVFQSSKCALTGAPLELPAVHFLCGHAFNLRSLGENDRECPLCATQFRAVLDIRDSLRAGAAEQVSPAWQHSCLVAAGVRRLRCCVSEARSGQRFAARRRGPCGATLMLFEVAFMP